MIHVSAIGKDHVRQYPPVSVVALSADCDPLAEHKLRRRRLGAAAEFLPDLWKVDT
jgi:hypothetical protein